RNLRSVAALARLGDVGLLHDRAARIVLAFADMAALAPVVVGIGPDRAGESADSRADGRTLEHAEAADRGARAGTQRAARGRTGRHRTERRRATGRRSRLITRRRALIVLAVVDVTVDATVTITGR